MSDPAPASTVDRAAAAAVTPTGVLLLVMTALWLLAVARAPLETALLHAPDLLCKML